MQILQTCPFAVAEPTAVVHEHKRWAGQTRIHSLVTTEIEHERELGRSRVLGILKSFFLELPSRIVLKDRLRMRANGPTDKARPPIKNGCGGDAPQA